MIKKSIITALLAAQISALPVQAQAQLVSVGPGKIDALFDRFAQPGSPGCSLGVIHDDKIILQRSYGLASLELGVPLSEKSVFYLGSVSKQFTAAATILAAQQGFLSLDDDLRKWVPEIPDYGHRITIRNLIHHTSGIRSYYPLLYLEGQAWEERRSNDELIALIAGQQHLNFDPGERFEYSNSNYLLLAEIVKRATGKPISQFAKENIFDPLGMTQTRYYDDSSMVVPNRVAAYEPRPEGGYKVAWSTMFDTVGAGGVMSTIGDLQRWDENFYTGKVGGQAFLDTMREHGKLNNGQDNAYTAGLFLYVDRGLPAEDHSGGLFGYRTYLLRYPTEKFSVIVLCNRSDGDPDGLGRQVANLYLKDAFVPLPKLAKTMKAPNPPVAPLQQPKPPAPPVYSAEDLAGFVGTFKSEETGATYRVKLVEGALQLRNGWNAPFKLTQIALDTFKGDFLTLRFIRDDAKKVTSINVATPYTSNHPFKRISNGSASRCLCQNLSYGNF